MYSYFRASSSPACNITSNRVINQEEINTENFSKAIDNWEIPKIAQKEIYDHSSFNFFDKMDRTIETEEHDITLFNDYETIRISSQSSINHHGKKYNFIYVGFISSWC